MLLKKGSKIVRGKLSNDFGHPLQGTWRGEGEGRIMCRCWPTRGGESFIDAVEWMKMWFCSAGKKPKDRDVGPQE